MVCAELWPYLIIIVKVRTRCIFSQRGLCAYGWNGWNGSRLPHLGTSNDDTCQDTSMLTDRYRIIYCANKYCHHLPLILALTHKWQGTHECHWCPGAEALEHQYRQYWHIRGFIFERECENVRVSEWVGELLSEWVNEWVSEWVIDWLTNWLADWRPDWLTASRWTGEQLTDWLNSAGVIIYFVCDSVCNQ